MNSILSKNLKELRQEMSLTKREVSQKTGLNYSTYLNYENKGKQPPLEVLVILAKFFEVSVDCLLGLADY